MTIYKNLSKSLLVASVFVLFAGVLPATVSAHDVPTCTLAASTEQIVEGGSTILTWSTTNTTSVSIDAGVGSVSTSGSKSVSPTSNTTYTLTASNGTDSVTCSTTVKVLSSTAVPTCSFTASPSSIAYGGSSTLEWDTLGASSVYINNGIGYVNAKDSVALTGFSTDVTYTLTAINGNGSKTCSVHIDVDGASTSNALAPSCNISASPQSVSYNGSVILDWASTGASYASISRGVGVVQKNGSKVVEHITDTTTFKLTVSNTHGSNTCSVTVYRDTTPTGPAPTCTIDVNPDSLSYAGNAELSWSAYHSTSASIDNSIGAVAQSDSKLVSPSNTTTYTMSVHDNLGRTGYCSKTVTVQGGNYYSGATNSYSGGSAYQAQYQYGNTIRLGNLPYTGAGDVLYVLAMLLLAVGSTFTVYKFGKELV